MLNLARPWERKGVGARGFSIGDCLLSEVEGVPNRQGGHSSLMQSNLRGKDVSLILHPYPKKANAEKPLRTGFPQRPRSSKEDETEEERQAREILRQMNEVLARVQELGEALDDPLNVWPRLRQAWARAENEEDPRLAEIVRQSRVLTPVLKELHGRIRRVLRRTTEQVSLDRVQEMDRAALRWLVRQPGRTIAEQAGASQRIKATVRRENFDTLENRVLHAYVRLAADVAREWLREHPRAQASKRYVKVEGFRTYLKILKRDLEDKNVGVADANVTPNYVLMQNPLYKSVWDAWRRLLEEEKAIDALWAWQSETWTDFAVLAIVLALDELDESVLVAQSPIVWSDEVTLGRSYAQDNPLAVFWLKSSGRVVEVQSRPSGPGTLLALSRAHVSLRITDPSRNDLPRNVAVWTPHTMSRLDMVDAVAGASARLHEVQAAAQTSVLRNGLILTPARGKAEVQSGFSGRCRVDGIALDASGEGLRDGLDAIRAFARSEIYGDAQE